jgi:hypothetical protein
MVLPHWFAAIEGTAAAKLVGCEEGLTGATRNKQIVTMPLIACVTAG